ncbi:MAG: seg [Parcubacteria group bacterium]|nr:seg [Parcubacteria group bacterium]
MTDKGQNKDIRQTRDSDVGAHLDDFVLEKGIFSNIFEKDIRRVYIYKKSERLAKAIHLVGPAFANSPALRNRVDLIAVGLVDAATLPPSAAREALSRELLALSSVLSIARVGGLLSVMNAELIAREAHTLLQEIATYEEPRLFFDEAPTLAALFKSVAQSARTPAPETPLEHAPARTRTHQAVKDTKGHSSAVPRSSTRRDAILSVLRTKGPSYIKDISTVIRDVSEKTIQRELASLVEEGLVTRSGERRWTTYTLAK